MIFDCLIYHIERIEMLGFEEIYNIISYPFYPTYPTYPSYVVKLFNLKTNPHFHTQIIPIGLKEASGIVEIV